MAVVCIFPSSSLTPSLERKKKEKEGEAPLGHFPLHRDLYRPPRRGRMEGGREREKEKVPPATQLLVVAYLGPETTHQRGNGW